MAGFTPRPAKTKILNDLVTGTTYVALATALPEVGEINMASIVPFEPTTGGYSRQAVTWGAATTVEPVTRANSAAITSSAMTADLPACPYAFLTTSASGTTGTLLYVWYLAQPVQALTGKPFHAPVGALVLE